MSNMVSQENIMEPQMEPEGSPANPVPATPAGVDVDTGNLNDVRPIPRVTIQAFCETDAVAQTLNMASKDRRMQKAHVKVNMGGTPAAVEFYGSAPTPNLIIVETKLSGSDLMADLGRLAQVCDAETKVVIIGHTNDVVVYRELIANGVSEYLIAPVSMADIMATCSDIFVNPENGVLGKMVAFIGAKGGTGSSTVCHNVSWAISSSYKTDVVLADLDLPFGTANINLDQDPPLGIADAVFSPDRVDDILLDRLLAKCADHLSLLAAPSSLERTYDFDPNAFNSIVEVAQKSTPCVMVDVPHQWNGWTKQILSLADEVVITAVPELANLRNTKNLIDTITDIRPNDGMPRLVLNQVGMAKRPEISVSDFVSPLGLEPLAVIPHDPAIFGVASNNGQMIPEADPAHAVSQTFDFLAQILTGKAELKAEKKSKLGFLSKLRKK